MYYVSAAEKGMFELTDVISKSSIVCDEQGLMNRISAGEVFMQDDNFYFSCIEAPSEAEADEIIKDYEEDGDLTYYVKLANRDFVFVKLDIRQVPKLSVPIKPQKYCLITLWGDGTGPYKYYVLRQSSNNTKAGTTRYIDEACVFDDKVKAIKAANSINAKNKARKFYGYTWKVIEYEEAVQKLKED